MGQYFTKEAIVALLKTLFVNWWKSQGKKLAHDEWAQISDLINERVAEVVGPRNGYLVTTPNGSLFEIKSDDEGIIYTVPVIKHNGQPVPPSPEFKH